MSDIPMRSKGPKYIAKAVMVEPEVWNQLLDRGVNMSELVRSAAETALRTLKQREQATPKKVRR
jgi:post-segregation antitoxin (ccd killing protein)